MSQRGSRHLDWPWVMNLIIRTNLLIDLSILLPSDSHQQLLHIYPYCLVISVVIAWWSVAGFSKRRNSNLGDTMSVPRPVKWGVTSPFKKYHKILQFNLILIMGCSIANPGYAWMKDNNHLLHLFKVGGELVRIGLNSGSRLSSENGLCGGNLLIASAKPDALVSALKMKNSKKCPKFHTIFEELQSLDLVWKRPSKQQQPLSSSLKRKKNQFGMYSLCSLWFTLICLLGLLGQFYYSELTTYANYVAWKGMK